MPKLMFQCVDAFGCDLSVEGDGGGGGGTRYVLTVLGRTEDGRCFATELHGWKPSFLVCLSKSGGLEAEKERLAGRMGGGFGKHRRRMTSTARAMQHERALKRAGVVSASVESRRRFRGFDGYRNRPYMKLEFESLRNMRRVRRGAYESYRGGSAAPMPGAPPLYDADLDPLLAIFHDRGVEACDWMVVDEATPGFRTPQKPNGDVVAFSASYASLRPPTDEERAGVPVFAPIRTMLFDAEMSSSHDEFPLAKKTAQRAAYAVLDAAAPLKAPGRRDLEACVAGCLLRAFDPESDDRLYLKSGRYPRDPETFRRSHAFDECLQDIVDTLHEPKRPWNDAVRGWDRTALISRFDDLIIRHLAPAGVQGDAVVQIGAVIIEAGKRDRGDRHVFVLGECDDIPGVTIHVCQTEASLLLAFADFVRTQDPDIVSGYNIIGFDLPYLFDRADELGVDVLDRVTDIGRIKRGGGTSGFEDDPEYFDDTPAHLRPLRKLRTQRLSTAADGDNCWRRWDMSGRVTLDQMVVIKKSHNLPSYSLDAVSGHFMFGKVGSVGRVEGGIVVHSSDVRGLVSGDYVTFSRMHGANREPILLRGSRSRSKFFGDDGDEVIRASKKARVESVTHGRDDAGSFVLSTGDDPRLAAAWCAQLKGSDRWNHAKDDVSPSDIFRLCRGDAADKAKLARYCIKDVVLTVELLGKILAIENAVAYANICCVPLSWVTDRGVGVKLHSLVAGACRKEGYAMPKLYKPKPRDNTRLLGIGTPRSGAMVASVLERRFGEIPCEAVEGAVVLTPKTGIYDKEGIAVLDFSSLYPSVIISRNMTHEAIAYRPEDVAVPDGSNRRRLEAMGYVVHDVTYESGVYTDVDPDNGRFIKPQSTGTRVARFVSRGSDDGSAAFTYGVIPSVLLGLLGARKKAKRAKAAAEKDGKLFLMNVMDGRQLAYKVAANSIYGQCASQVSSFRYTPLAAATTADGRNMLHHARAFVERHYTPERPLLLPQTTPPTRVEGALVVYGDTDSIFVKFRVVDAATGEPVTGELALRATILAGEDAERAAGTEPWLRHPHRLEYEKTYYPLILLKRKGYVGMKYMAGKTTASLNSMGIVLKRRDNPPILKKIYGDMIHGLMNGVSFDRIVDAIQRQVQELLMRGQSTTSAPRLEDLVITKRLRGQYKKPDTIAHCVLAKRITARDPGNAPKSNDRIEYVFVKNPKARLQGERIETPEYIRANPGKVRPDYEHYVRNIIMKPVSQVLALRLSELKGFDPRGWTTTVNNRRDQVCSRQATKEARTNETDLLHAKTRKCREEIVRKMEADVEPPKSDPRGRRNYRARLRKRKARLVELDETLGRLRAQQCTSHRNTAEALLQGSAAATRDLPTEYLRKLQEREAQRLVFDAEVERSRHCLGAEAPLSLLGFKARRVC